MNDKSKTKKELIEELEKLRSDYNFLLHLTDNSRDVLYRMRLSDGVYEYMGAAAERVFGYSPDAFYAAPGLTQEIIHPDWHDYFQKEWKKLERGDLSPFYEYQIVHKDGRVRWMHQRNQIVTDSEGTPVAIEGIITDVTGRKEAESELAMIIQAMDNAVTAFSIVAIGGKIIYANRAFAAMFGYSVPEKIIGADVVRVFGSMQRYQDVLAILKSGRNVETELSGKKSDGSAIEVKLYARKGTRANGETIYFATLIDITEQKKSEQALRDSEAQIRSIFHAAPVGIGISKNRQYVMVNDQYCRMTGYEQDEIIGQNALLVSRDKESYERQAAESFKEMIETGSSTFESEIRRKDGSLFPVLVNLTPLNPDNLKDGFSFMTLDITEQKRQEKALRESEARFRSIFRASPIGIGMVTNQRFVDVNDRYCQDLGYSREELIGQTGEIVFRNSEELQRIQDENFPTLFKEGTVTYECDHKRKDGSIIRAINSITLLDTEGEDKSFTFAMIDITEQKRYETALRESENRIRSVFDNAPVGMGVSIKSVFQEVNDQFCSMTGYTREELLGQSSRILFESDEYFEQYRGRGGRELEEKGTTTYECDHVSKDGAIIRLLISLTLIDPADPDGPSTFIVVDLTDQRNQEKALRESENRIRSVFDNAPMGMGVSIKSVFQEVNDQFCSMTGYTREELLGQSSRILFESDEYFEQYRGRGGRELEEKGTTTYECDHVSKDGAIIRLLISLTLIDPADPDGPSTFIVVDLTDQRNQEKALRESENRIRSVFDNAPMGMGILLNSEFQEVNDQFCDFIGYTREELIGQSTRIVFPSDEEFLKIRQLSIEGRTSVGSNTFECNNRRKDGEIRRVIVTLNAFDPEDPEGPYTFISLDVTEQKRNEMALLDSEARMRSIFSATPIGIGFVIDGVYTEVNDRYCQDLGYTREELIGQTGEMVFTSREEQDRVERENSEELFETGSATYECDHRRKDGTVIRVLISMTLISHRIEDGFAFVMMDITKQRRQERALVESEERIRSIFSATPVGMGVVTNRKYAEVNDRYCQDLGFTREELIGQTVGTVFEDDELKKVVREYLPIIQQEGTVTYECNNRRKDGSIIRVLVSMAVIDTGDDNENFTFVMLDITEQRRQERALVESEARIRSIFHAAPVGMGVTKDSIYQEVNDQYCSIMGYEREEIIGKSSRIVYESEEEFLEHRMQNVKNIMEHGSATFECDHIRKDGGIIRVIVTLIPIDQNDPESPFTFILIDITEQKRNEMALKDLNRRLEDIVKAGNVGLWDWNVTTGKVFFSREWKNQIGFEDDELENDIKSWESRLHAEDLEKTKESIKALIDGRSDNFDVEFRMRHKDGSWRWINARGKRADSGRSGQTRLIGTHLDVTAEKEAADALKKNEEQLRIIIENLPGTVIAHDYDGNVLIVNKQAEEKMGYTHDELLGMHIDEIDPSSVTRNDRENLWPTIASEGSKTFEGVNRRKDGTEYPVEIHLTATQLGATPIIVAMTLDISDRKEAEKERRNLEEQLRQSQKMEAVGRLAGGVAHDFNNMLNVILLHSELLLEDIEEDRPEHEDISEIARAAKRSADLTRQLLAFARRQTISPKIIDINETIESMLKMLKRLIGEDIELDWHPGDNISSLRLDPGQIDQMLANLCVNARDAIDGVGKITIETRNVDVDEDYVHEHKEFMPGSYVMLAVADDGVGMDEEVQHKVFEPFFTTKGPGEGTGLGLATVYGIIRQNGGFVNLYSEPGHGTVFRLYFPIHKGVQKIISTEKGPKGAKHGSGTILLVEDDALNLKTTTKLLTKAGYSVLAAPMPSQAIKLAEEHSGKIPLLITDVIMPEMNGRDLAGILQERYPTMKCIFMSGYTANVIAHHGVLDQGVVFIQKPYTLKDITELVSKVLKD